MRKILFAVTIILIFSGIVQAQEAPSPPAPFATTTLPVPNRPTWGDCRVLSANTAKPYTVPSWASQILISSDLVPFYACFLNGCTAVIPTSDLSDGTASISNLILVPVTPGSAISFIAPVATVITIVPIKQ